MPLFENVVYHISDSLPEDTRIEISRILDSNGAIATADLKSSTHVISNTIEFEGCDKLANNVVCVTPFWVERSMELGTLQDATYFSADKARFFSGVIATCADLPEGDREVIASGIQEQGGSWKEGLTRDITHLIVTNTNSEKYRVAMHWREAARITIVLPHWFDQCWAMQTLIPPTIFQFPDPPFLKHEHDASWYKAQLSHKENKDHLDDGFDKKVMFYTLTREPSFRQRSPRDIWRGRKLLLSASLELNDVRKKALEERILSASGLVLSATLDTEGTVVDDADILVTRYRSGPAYARALAKGKTIGSLAWFLYVDKTGTISRPRDRLLHYPVHPNPVPGFEHHEITVTNYQGDARDYIKKLIQLMGATFTPTMSGKNTVVIAAYKSGTKTSKAEEWSVPIVHHKWLEDCFIEWRNLTPAVKKYVDFTPGFNYGTLLGERGVGHLGLLETNKEKDINPPPVAVPVSPSKSPKKSSSVENNSGQVVGVTNSLREALEVEEVLNIPEAPFKIGPPRSAKSSPAKGGALDRQMTESPSRLSGPSTKFAGKNAPSIDEEEAEEVKEDEIVEVRKPGAAEKKTVSRSESKSKSKSKPRSEAKVVDSDDSIQEIPLPSKKIGLSKTVQEFSTGSSRNLDEEGEVYNHIPNGSKDAEGRDRSNSDGSRHASPQRSKSKQGPPSKPAPLKRSLPSLSDISSDDEIIEVKRHKIVKTYKSPSKLKVTPPSVSSLSGEEDTDGVENQISKKQAPGHKAIAQNALRPSSSRTVTVELPDPRSVLKSTGKKTIMKPLTLQDNSDVPNPSSSSVTSLYSSTSRRTAAAAATLKLHTQVMPDVMNFEIERKRSSSTTRRRKSSLGTALGDDSEASVRVVKKARISARDDESDDVPSRLVTHVKDMKRSADDKADGSGKKEKNTRPSKPGGAIVQRLDGSSSMDPKKIRVLTTKIDVPEDVEQTLVKLGVKFTSKPNECTHLIGSGMTRTEKFLCALPQAPFVLNKDWLAACAKEKRIVAEGPFALEDPDVEQKHKFKLSEALERARELKKKKTKLLQGHMFYITPSVKIDNDMLLNILKANGADGKRATPNLRNLSDTRHILSCLKDEHLWRSLEKSGIPIYSQELVLSAAFKQFIDWDSPEMRVQAEAT